MRPHLGLLVLVLAAAIPVGAQSPASEHTPEQIVMHHLSAFAADDLKGVLDDYADAATVITASGATRGKPALRKTFATMMARPAASRPALVLQSKVFAGNVGYITWVQNAGQPNEVRGSDTFVIQDGKIATQTVAVVPMHAPPK